MKRLLALSMVLFFVACEKTPANLGSNIIKTHEKGKILTNSIFDYNYGLQSKEDLKELEALLNYNANFIKDSSYHLLEYANQTVLKIIHTLYDDTKLDLTYDVFKQDGEFVIGFNQFNSKASYLNRQIKNTFAKQRADYEKLLKDIRNYYAKNKDLNTEIANITNIKNSSNIVHLGANKNCADVILDTESKTIKIKLLNQDNLICKEAFGGQDFKELTKNTKYLNWREALNIEFVQ